MAAAIAIAPTTARIWRASAAALALLKPWRAISAKISTASPARKYSIAVPLLARLLHLLEQQPRTGAVAGVRQPLEREAATGGIDCNRRQKLAELARRAGIEAAPGALGQPRDLTISALGHWIAAFLEQEH